ncbi:hypothetical protein [Rhodohalobacter sp. 614A]|uniref:hypothetical protein n=1 Tax=Rhodohalobacter sp. 614A TaxID=2908649 RepID=UPI001F376767|nr:hypothetical protein [Rhodohalobacter sp. 614A]
MTNQEITQEKVNELLSDAEYLLDEAEALKYVIDAVPYSETPPEGLSIYNMLKLIDHAQANYYRPITERVISENRLVRLSDFEHYKDTFEEITDEEEINIQKTLSKIIKHRAALINVFKRISLIDWEKELRGDRGELLCLFDLASKMIRDERKTLKEIADLVLIYQNERQHQREIEKKASQQKSS